MKMLIKTRREQAGITMYGIMFVLIVIGFMATAAIKLGPHYIDNNVVKNALNDIKANYANTDMQNVSDNEIKGKLNKYFEVNMVDDEIARSAKVTREKQKVTLSLNYEIRTNFISNIDVVLVFNNEVDLAK